MAEAAEAAMTAEAMDVGVVAVIAVLLKHVIIMVDLGKMEAAIR